MCAGEGPNRAFVGNMPGKKDTYIVHRTVSLLELLSKFSFWDWFNIDRRGFGAVDSYVCAWSIASVLSYILAAVLPTWASTILIIPGIIRVHEITNFHSLLLLRGGYAGRSLRSYQRSFLLLGLNVLEIVFWFSLFYSILRQWGLLVVTDDPVAITILRESVGLMVANASDNFNTQGSVLTSMVLLVHSIVGLFMTAVVLGHSISLLPAPGNLDKCETSTNDPMPK